MFFLRGFVIDSRLSSSPLKQGFRPFLPPASPFFFFLKFIALCRFHFALLFPTAPRSFSLFCYLALFIPSGFTVPPNRPFTLLFFFFDVLHSYLVHGVRGVDCLPSIVPFPLPPVSVCFFITTFSIRVSFPPTLR